MTSFWTLRRQMDDLMNQMMSMDDASQFGFLHDPYFNPQLLSGTQQQQQLQQPQQATGAAGAGTGAGAGAGAGQSTSLVGTQDQPQQLGLFQGLGAPQSIRCDVHEEKDKFIVTAEMPGISKEHVHVTLDNGFLTIAGDKKEIVNEKQESEGRVIRRRERKFGQFSRSFRLPTMAESDNVMAKYNHGILTLDIPKVDKPSQQSKRIQIQ